VVIQNLPGCSVEHMYYYCYYWIVVVAWLYIDGMPVVLPRLRKLPCFESWRLFRSKHSEELYLLKSVDSDAAVSLESAGDLILEGQMREEMEGEFGGTPNSENRVSWRRFFVPSQRASSPLDSCAFKG
jgi:hypothetical protein